MTAISASDRIQISMRKETAITATLGLVLTSVSPVSASTEQDYDENYAFRAAVMGPGSLTVCYSEEAPIEVEGLGKKDLFPHKIIIYDADCVSFDGEEILEKKGVMVELFNAHGAEIIDLNEFRNNNLEIPKVFESIDDDSVFLPSPFIDEDEEINEPDYSQTA